MFIISRALKESGCGGGCLVETAKFGAMTFVPGVVTAWALWQNFKASRAEREIPFSPRMLGFFAIVDALRALILLSENSLSLGSTMGQVCNAVPAAVGLTEAVVASRIAARSSQTS